MHYLKPFYRAQLMYNLYDLANNKGLGNNTRLLLSYELLKGSSKLNYYKPCLKKYLYSHLKTTFVWIRPIEWDYVLFLPLASFQKKSQIYVWKESEKKIKS